MFRTVFRALTLCVLVSQFSPVQAQLGRRYFASSAYDRLGLEQVWTTHIQFDSARSNVGSIVLQVVGMDSYEQLQQVVYRVFEVNYDGRSIRFSENDVDASGQRLGREEAQRLAEKQAILLDAGFQNGNHDARRSAHDDLRAVKYGNPACNRRRNGQNPVGRDPRPSRLAHVRTRRQRSVCGNCQWLDAVSYRPRYGRTHLGPAAGHEPRRVVGHERPTCLCARAQRASRGLFVTQ